MIQYNKTFSFRMPNVEFVRPFLCSCIPRLKHLVEELAGFSVRFVTLSQGRARRWFHPLSHGSAALGSARALPVYDGDKLRRVCHLALP